MLAKIAYNKEIDPNYYKMGLIWKPDSPVIPGQFVMLRVFKGIDPFLRRPFAIYRVGDLDEGKRVKGVEILYRVVGKGTILMSQLVPGTFVDLFGPLGKGFPEYTGDGKLIMIAGGVGIAPFYMLTERMLSDGKRVKLLFGGKCREDLPGMDDFKSLGIDMKIATENGELGTKGLITMLLEREVVNDSTVYACGPLPMLKEIAQISIDKGVPCFVSIDRRMACGIGACLGCAVMVHAHREKLPPSKHYSEHSSDQPYVYSMVCNNGPVFDAREIIWENL